MKFDDPANKFPRFRSYVSDLNKLAVPENDGKANPIFNALMTWAKISNEQAVSYFKPGQDPTIVVAMVSAKDAIKQFPEKVSVPLAYVESYEKNDHSATVLTNKEKRVYKVGLFMLEAIIAGRLSKFSADRKDSDMSNVNKAIGGFEQEAYGGIKGRTFVP
jgi:hypothetical protein